MSMVVDLHKKKGETPAFDVYIGRKNNRVPWTYDSKWGNYSGDLASYELYAREYLWDDLEELDGMVLGCWCITTDKVEPLVCHGQVLMKLLREKKELD